MDEVMLSFTFLPKTTLSLIVSSSVEGLFSLVGDQATCRDAIMALSYSVQK